MYRATVYYGKGSVAVSEGSTEISALHVAMAHILTSIEYANNEKSKTNTVVSFAIREIQQPDNDPKSIPD